METAPYIWAEGWMNTVGSIVIVTALDPGRSLFGVDEWHPYEIGIGVPGLLTTATRVGHMVKASGTGTSQ